MRILAFLLMCCFSVTLSAQDQHFTQFYASPTTLNPALTGAFPGKYRISMIYRDQWRKTLDNPYSTFSAAADFRFLFKPYKRRYKDAFGVGIVFYNDNVSELDFSTNQVMVSGAFHKSLNPESNQFLSLGVQTGMVQRNIGYGALDFDDQFNGNNGFTDPTAEVLPENNFAFSDFQVGLNYSSTPERGIGLFLGASLHHLMEPEVSFFFDDEDPNNLSPSSKLYRKYSGQVALQIPFGSSIQFLPRAIYYQQGPHAALNAGANFRFLVNDVNGTALHLGSWLRPVKSDEGSFELESAIGMIGVEYSNFLFGFSYDANLSQLSSGRRNQGAFEISVAYLGEYEDDTVLCPSF